MSTANGRLHPLIENSSVGRLVTNRLPSGLLRRLTINNAQRSILSDVDTKGAPSNLDELFDRLTAESQALAAEALRHLQSISQVPIDHDEELQFLEQLEEVLNRL